MHRETPVLKSLFNKVAGLKACSFIKKRLQHRCFPVNIAKFLRAPILKNILSHFAKSLSHFNENVNTSEFTKNCTSSAFKENKTNS